MKHSLTAPDPSDLEHRKQREADQSHDGVRIIQGDVSSCVSSNEIASRAIASATPVLLDAVIQETMRLRPTFRHRTARNRAFELPGLTIPSGTMVVPCITLELSRRRAERVARRNVFIAPAHGGRVTLQRRRPEADRGQHAVRGVDSMRFTMSS